MSVPLVKIKQLGYVSLTPNDLKCISGLLSELSGKTVRFDEHMLAENRAERGHISVFLAYAEQPNAEKPGQEQVIVGMASLVPVHTLSHHKGLVEDVVVHKEYQGRGIGKFLMQHVIEQAKILGLQHIELTSNPSREAANALYLKLGFKPRETNTYRLAIPSPLKRLWRLFCFQTYQACLFPRPC